MEGSLLFGTGCPQLRTVFARCIITVLCVLGSGFSLLAAEPNVPVPTMKIRLEWGGNQQAKVWNGTLRISNGRFLNMVALDIESDTPGRFLISDDEIVIRGQSPRWYSGLDVTMELLPESILTLELYARAQSENVIKIEVPLQDLLIRDHKDALDGQGNRIVFHRMVSDVIRFQSSHDRMIFSPGEIMSAKVVVPVYSPVSWKQAVDWELYQSNSFRRLNQGHLADLPAGSMETLSVPLEFAVPKKEGVYTLFLRIRNQYSVVEQIVHQRRIEFVVYGQDGPTPYGWSEYDFLRSESRNRRVLIAEIDPVRESQFSFFRNPFPNFLTYGTTSTLQSNMGPLLRMGQKMSRFSHSRQRQVASWVGCHLKLNNPGRPHVLEIDYPENGAQTLGIHILEQQSGRPLHVVSQNTGVYVDSTSQLQEAMGTHSLLFWPRTFSPVVVLSNLSRQQIALLGHIRLYEVQDALLPGSVPEFQTTRTFGEKLRDVANRALRFTKNGKTTLEKSESEILSRQEKKENNRIRPNHESGESQMESSGLGIFSQAGFSKRARSFGVYLSKPLFPEDFGASGQTETVSGRTLDDWMTFWEAAQRMVGYMKYQGYNSIILAVWADGSTIYPSNLLYPTPRYDTGGIFSDSPDPVRKDVLELLMRICDRAGVELIPEIQFSTPLPRLERLITGSASDQGIRLTHRNGHLWQLQPGFHRVPYYNPIHEKVQQEMQNVVQELVSRYSHHPAFGGISVQLSEDGYAQLPGVDWGYDFGTVQQFVSETGVKVPLLNGDQKSDYAGFLLGKVQREWLNWRTRKLTELYSKFHQIVTSERSDSLLFLNAVESLGGSRGSTAVFKALREGKPQRELLIDRGIDPIQLSAQTGIVWLKPGNIAPMHLLAGGALENDANTSSEMDAMIRASSSAGSLFYHPPHQFRLESLQNVMPASQSKSYFLSQTMPSGIENRRRFAQSLASLDAKRVFDGGWMFPMGQEQILRRWRRAFLSLPAETFQPVSGQQQDRSTQPITVRKYESLEETVLYIVNESPWSVPVSIRLQIPAGVKIDVTSSGAQPDYLTEGPSLAVIKFASEAYDLCVLRFNQPGVQVEAIEVEISDSIRKRLKHQLDQLAVQLEQLPGPQESRRLTEAMKNPGFEQSQKEDSQLPEGWEFQVRQGQSFVRDPVRPHSGKYALRCPSPAQIQSHWMVSPPRSFLGIQVRLRSAKEGDRVRLGIEGVTSEGRYHHVSEPIHLQDKWINYLLRVVDMPFRTMEQIRFQIEFMDESTVWVDTVELVALPISRAENIQLMKTQYFAKGAWQKGRLSDCRRWLNSYWVRFLRNQLSDIRIEKPARVSLRAKDGLP